MGFDLYATLDKEFDDEPSFCSGALASHMFELNQKLLEAGCHLFKDHTYPEEGHEPNFLEPEQVLTEYGKAFSFIKNNDQYKDLEQEFIYLKEAIDFAAYNKSKISFEIA